MADYQRFTNKTEDNQNNCGRIPRKSYSVPKMNNETRRKENLEEAIQQAISLLDAGWELEDVAREIARVYQPGVAFVSFVLRILLQSASTTRARKASRSENLLKNPVVLRGLSYRLVSDDEYFPTDLALGEGGKLLQLVGANEADLIYREVGRVELKPAPKSRKTRATAEDYDPVFSPEVKHQASEMLGGGYE
jgi:hypothetical protein